MSEWVADRVQVSSCVVHCGSKAKNAPGSQMKRTPSAAIQKLTRGAASNPYALTAIPTMAQPIMTNATPPRKNAEPWKRIARRKAHTKARNAPR